VGAFKGQVVKSYQFNPGRFAAIMAGAGCFGWGACAHAAIITLASFNGSNGANPQAGLAVSGSTLFGTAYTGGANNSGTVFSLPVTGGTPAVLASFNYSNGQNPQADLIVSNNKLYGTTAGGGANGVGVVFSLPLTGGAPTVLASFNNSNGRESRSRLTLFNNALFGTTIYGGSIGAGVVFSVPVNGGTPTVLASFNGNTGYYPHAGIVLSGNTLYGTLWDGGANVNYGAVFSLPVTGGTPTRLASFNGSNGDDPQAEMILVGSKLYGTTYWGGANNDGVVFSVPLTGGTPSVLASFNGTNGLHPDAGLTVSADGNTLYGTTFYGGSNGYGAIFSVPLAGGAISVLASFDGSNGRYPHGLLLSGNTLYGTTVGGGAYGNGTVFAVDIPEPASLSVFAFVPFALSCRRTRVSRRRASV
jgi:uncharacterized repeat protein (TIGR03803 family)